MVGWAFGEPIPTDRLLATVLSVAGNRPHRNLATLGARRAARLEEFVVDAAGRRLGLA